MFRTQLGAAALCLVSLVLVPACGGGSGTTGAIPQGDTGRTLKISVTDAPFPSAFVESATVEITRVEVKDDTAGGWQTVFSGSRTIDLVPLVGGVSELLIDAALEPGTYSQVRLIVEAGTVTLTPEAVVQDDHVFTVADGDLKFPSASQSGLKIKIDTGIVVTSTLSGDLMLDFDLSKSFVFNGPFTRSPGVKRVIFKPVVRATNSSESGTLTLDVLSDAATPADTEDDVALEGATVRLFDALDAEVAMGLSDVDGHFATSVAPGTYRVTVEAAAHDTGEILGASVAVANASDLGSISLVASATEITGVILSDGATPADATDDTNLDGAQVDAVVTGDATNTVVATATTDVNGAYVLPMLAVGTYDLTVTATGWTTLAIPAVPSLVPGSAAGTDATLVALTRDLTGTVSDNVPVLVAGATVTVTNANGTVIGTSAATAADGVYTIAGVPSGTHTLSADDGVSTVTVSITVVGTAPATNQTENIQFP